MYLIYLCVSLVIVGIAIPQMVPLVGLLTAISMTTMMLLIPVLIETTTKWRTATKLLFAKNIGISVLWIFLLVSAHGGCLLLRPDCKCFIKKSLKNSKKLERGARSILELSKCQNSDITEKSNKNSSSQINGQLYCAVGVYQFKHRFLSTTTNEMVAKYRLRWNTETVYFDVRCKQCFVF